MLKYLLEHNMIDGSTITVTGRTLAENLEECKPLRPGQQVIMPLDKPIKPEGHLQILYGNLAPEGSGAWRPGGVVRGAGTACRPCSGGDVLGRPPCSSRLGLAPCSSSADPPSVLQLSRPSPPLPNRSRQDHGQGGSGV